MKRYVIPFVTLSFWIISLYSEICGILHPVLFRCYHRNKEVVARDSGGYWEAMALRVRWGCREEEQNSGGEDFKLDAQE